MDDQKSQTTMTFSTKTDDFRNGGAPLNMRTDFDDVIKSKWREERFEQESLGDTTIRSNASSDVDRGYAWIIMMAAFLMQLLYNGYYKCMGLFLVEFQKEFGSNSSMTSLVVGLTDGFASVSVFVAMTFLIKHAKPRTIALCGAFLMTSAVIGNSYATSVEVLYITQGLCFGTGLGCVFGPTMYVLTEYFEKRRAIATSLATCGGSVGGMVMPILVICLLDTYCFRGGILLTAGMIMHYVVVAALLRPIESCSTLLKQNRCLSEDTETMVHQKTPKDRMSRLAVSSDAFVFGSSCTIHSVPKEEMFPYLSGKHSRTSLNSVPHSISTDFLESEMSSEDPEPDEGGCSPRLLCGNSLFRSGSFWTLFGYFICANIGQVLPQIFLPALVKERGLTEADAAQFIAIISVLELLGRIGSGFVVNSHWMRSSTVVMLPLTSIGIVCMLTPLFHSYISLLCMVIVMGMFVGVYFSMITLVVIEAFGMYHFRAAYGAYLSVLGLMNGLAFPLAGALKDETGTYSSTFMFIGSCNLMAVVLLLVTRSLRRRDINKGLLKLSETSSVEIELPKSS